MFVECQALLNALACAHQCEKECAFQAHRHSRDGVPLSYAKAGERVSRPSLAFPLKQRPDDRVHASGLRGIGRRSDRIPACDGGFRCLGTRRAPRLEALLERFQLTLAALRGDGFGRGDGECDLEVQEQRLALGAAFLQLSSRSH